MFIYLIAVGSVEKRLLLACAKNVKEVFGFEVRISDVPVYYKSAYNPHRGTVLCQQTFRTHKGSAFTQHAKGGGYN
jgi:archaemetzincin